MSATIELTQTKQTQQQNNARILLINFILSFLSLRPLCSFGLPIQFCEREGRNENCLCQFLHGSSTPFACRRRVRYPRGAAGLCRARLPAGALSSPFSWLTFYHVSFRFDTAFYGNSTNGAADLKSLIKSPGAVPASLFPRFTNSWGCCSTNQKNRIARSPFPNL